MKIHKNARLTPLRREEMAKSVLAGEMNRREAARSFGVTAGTVAKWVGRFRDLGPAGCADRSSRPRRMSRLTPGHVVERVVSLRRHRLTGARIAAATGVSTATVSRIIKRAGLSRIKGLKPEKPARHYEHDNPGDMTASTSRGPSASTGPATESPEPGPAAAREPAGSAPASAPATPRASPATACSPTSGETAPSAAWRSPWPTTSASGSPSAE